MAIINLPRRSDIRLPPARANHKSRPKATVAHLRPVTPPAVAKVDSRPDYDRASLLDETDPRAAIPMYEAIIARHDTWEALSVTNLGNCYYRTCDKYMAEACWRRAIELDVNQPEAVYNLGYLELERGDATAALVLLRRACELDPRFADAWFNRGMAAEQVACGQCPEARLCFGRYARLEPAGVFTEKAKERLA